MRKQTGPGLAGLPISGVDGYQSFAAIGAHTDQDRHTGGIHFAIATDGTVHRSTAASRDSDFHPVAADLQDFLDQLRAAAIRFVETGQPRRAA
ncbi:MAG TPA: hypothetical protein VFU65_21775 [Actinocrinis sp.]|nr:hypothetical protein [Actinocrinis sp.]